MNASRYLSRRALLGEGVQWLAAGSTACFITACGDSNVEKGKATACSDPAGLSAGEISLRASMQYTEKSPVAAQACEACAFFTAASAANACGNCTILNGSVNRAGHCQSWSARG